MLGRVKAKPSLRDGCFASLDPSSARRGTDEVRARSDDGGSHAAHLFILETLRKIASLETRIRKHDADLARQLRRASSSIALNCVEARGSQGGNVKLRFRSALGSTYETRACLDVAQVFGYIEADAQLNDDLDRIGATLYRLIV